MTQKPRTLILTRPKAQSIATLAALSAVLGREPDHIIEPLIEISPLPIDLPSNLVEPFIFTSRNAVHIASQKTTQRGKCICVGLRVAEFANDVGFHVKHRFETVADLISFGVPSKASYLRGVQVSTEFGQTSDQFQEFVLYKQVPCRLSLKTREQIAKNGLVPVYSENAAQRLFESVGNGTLDATAICISEKVAKRLVGASFKQVLVTSSPTSKAMIEKLAKFF